MTHECLMWKYEGGQSLEGDLCESLLECQQATCICCFQQLEPSCWIWETSSQLECEELKLGSWFEDGLM